MNGDSSHCSHLGEEEVTWKQILGPQGTDGVKEQWGGQCGKGEMSPSPHLIIGNPDSLSPDVWQ